MKSTASPLIQMARFLIPALLFATIPARALWAKAPVCAPFGSQALVGVWESRQVSKGGIGHAFQFSLDGTFVDAMTVIVDFHYEISGDRLISTQTFPQDSAPPTELKFRVDGDRLIETTNGSETSEKERVGKAEAGAPPIVGIWQPGGRPTGTFADHIYERYTRDGRSSLQIVLRRSSGCYKVKADRLTLSTPGDQETFTFRQSPGELILVESPGRGSFTYAREEAGFWYDSEPAGQP
jgi:hypothetical protein